MNIMSQSIAQLSTLGARRIALCAYPIFPLPYTLSFSSEEAQTGEAEAEEEQGGGFRDYRFVTAFTALDPAKPNSEEMDTLSSAWRRG